MSAFVRSVVQGNALGVSMGIVMRNLAADMRVRRRQQAEERAHKAPVKMLFPLIFLMFPALRHRDPRAGDVRDHRAAGREGVLSGLHAWTQTGRAARGRADP